ncbi:MAG: hypothetical protein IRY95_05355 [Clostridia bacterium]|nr:hypothetical protein [Clostridia bacterium]
MNTWRSLVLAMSAAGSVAGLVASPRVSELLASVCATVDGLAPLLPVLRWGSLTAFALGACGTLLAFARAGVAAIVHLAAGAAALHVLAYFQHHAGLADQASALTGFRAAYYAYVGGGILLMTAGLVLLLQRELSPARRV